MILYGLFSLFLILLGIILTPLASLPGISSVESAIQPYINALIQLIQSGSNLIGFFVPISLLKVLLPIVLSIELIVSNLDIIKFAFKKITGH
jgi:hypothetical protein